MSFRRSHNRHDIWKALVRENADLLAQLPPTAIQSEQIFRDYVTSGVHNGSQLNPSVFELPAEALESLWSFIEYKAQFNMDASLFENFNQAYREMHANRADQQRSR